ncbi:hypothetical protein VO54_01894 [Elizabethkingia miricola]|nr:hypothetical protein VO54_01894 [Elizabethkingia miricola]
MIKANTIDRFSANYNKINSKGTLFGISRLKFKKNESFRSNTGNHSHYSGNKK